MRFLPRQPTTAWNEEWISDKTRFRLGRSAPPAVWTRPIFAKRHCAKRLAEALCPAAAAAMKGKKVAGLR